MGTWLSWWGDVPQTERSLVWFSVRAQAWVASLVSCIDVSLSLSLSPPSPSLPPLSKIKYIYIYKFNLKNYIWNMVLVSLVQPLPLWRQHLLFLTFELPGQWAHRDLQALINSEHSLTWTFFSGRLVLWVYFRAIKYDLLSIIYWLIHPANDYWLLTAMLYNVKQTKTN